TGSVNLTTFKNENRQGRHMRTAFWIVYFLLATRAWAGEVVLKNGDRLTGRIIRMDKSIVDFETDLLGKVAVPWNAIVKIQSDSPLYVAVTDDRVVPGKVSMRDGPPGDRTEKRRHS